MRMAYIKWNGTRRAALLERDSAILLDGMFGQWRKTDIILPLSEVEFCCIERPSKVVAVGLNYRQHIEEMGEKVHDDPVLFLKPPTAVIGPGEAIVLPVQAGQVDYEAELAVVIKKEARYLSPQQVNDAILGYTCLNDVTARELQKKDGQWTRAKGFDTFCPIGPIVTDEIDPNHVQVKLVQNGKVRQNGNTSMFLYPVQELISYISSVMTLLPGDVVTTGTPPGIGPMQAGDTVCVEIEGIGQLINPVKQEIRR